MSARYRLAQLAEKVKVAGFAGKSMTDELSKIAQAEDLTHDEISRVAEIANRDVQLGLYKTATDKRFKFELADPAPVKAAARKTASTLQSSSVGSFEKVASAIDEVGGDPFAAPFRSKDNLSLLQHVPNEETFAKIAADRQEFEDRNQLFELDKARLGVEAMFREGEQWAAKIAGSAVDNEKTIVQSAMDMVHSGVTLPSIYEALAAAVSGSTVPEEEMENAALITRMIIEGLKARGVENYKMGFRDHGDPEAMAKMTTEQLVERCKQLSSYSQPRQENTFSMRDVKTAAQYTEAHVSRGETGRDANVDAGATAMELLQKRPSVMDHKVPQMYLDDAQNTPNNAPRVINASSEFIVAVRNLVGEQGRLRQVHGAQEYLGLKLKQLEEAMRKLTSIRKIEEDRMANKAQMQGVG